VKYFQSKHKSARLFKVVLFFLTALLTTALIHFFGLIEARSMAVRDLLALVAVFLFISQYLIDQLLDHYALDYHEQRVHQWLSAPLGILTAGFAYTIIHLSIDLL